MSALSFCAKLFSFLVLLLAAIIGALVAGVPTKLGFWHYIAEKGSDPTLKGMFPATMGDIPWGYSFARLSREDLRGQTALVTGANSGLGFSTALHLARQGAKVILACRSSAKCDAAADAITANSTGADVTTLPLDTSSLHSVRDAAEAVLGGIDSLDMLVLNAGRGMPPGPLLSEDNIEITFATNHVGHQLLYNLLLPIMQDGGATGAARVVLVSSAANYDSFEYGVATSREQLNSAPACMQTYGQSKLAQVLFAQEATRRLGPGAKVYVNAAHPGAVDTNIWEQMRAIVGDGVLGKALIRMLDKLRAEFMWTGDDGALTQLYLAAATEELVAKDIRGKYFHPQAREVVPSKHAANLTLQMQVWEFTERLIAESGA